MPETTRRGFTTAISDFGGPWDWFLEYLDWAEWFTDRELSTRAYVLTTRGYQSPNMASAARAANDGMRALRCVPSPAEEPGR